MNYGFAPVPACGSQVTQPEALWPEGISASRSSTYLPTIAPAIIPGGTLFARLIGAGTCTVDRGPVQVEFTYRSQRSYLPPRKEHRMSVATQTINGVDVNRLVSTIDAIKENPDLARFQFRSETRWDGGARSTTTIDSFHGAGSEHRHARKHSVPGDEPDVLLGDDSAPNAVETVLAALASCLTVGYAYNAAARGIEIEELRFELEGEIDLHPFLGLSDDPRPGYKSIHVRYWVKSPASRDQLVELCDYVQRTSPVLDVIANRVPVTVDLVA
jgi:uncharacterized OsmC-like protein